jgi:aryl-alcohol dehydrogenase-like predicted oxidoreductase
MSDNTKLDRRSALRAVISGAAAAGIIGSRSAVLAEDKAPVSGDGNPPKPTILRRPLGKTGLEIPVVSMGCMNSFDAALVKRSYEIGIRHFDTAAGYGEGRNEEMLGRAIQELDVRDQVVIATKVHLPRRPSEVDSDEAKRFFLTTVAESLRRLRTDYIDVLYAHSMYGAADLQHPGILAALRELKESKKVRHVGFSTHRGMAECLTEAARMGFYEVVLTTFNVAFADDGAMLGALTQAASAGIGLIAMKTQCSYRSRRSFPEAVRERLRGQLMQTALLKWVLNNPAVTSAIPGFTDFAQMEEDFSVAYGLEYTEEEREFLVKRGFRYASAFCVGCGGCLDTCPHRVTIPDLMRVHMYSMAYGNAQQARATLDRIPPDQGLARCADCAECRADCRRAVPIARRISDLRATYLRA